MKRFHRIYYHLAYRTSSCFNKNTGRYFAVNHFSSAKKTSSVSKYGFSIIKGLKPYYIYYLSSEILPK